MGINKNTGGPAFPCEVDPDRLHAGDHQTGHRLFQQYGMTLRDFFAAKYMQGVCSTAFYTDGNFMSGEVAEHAYEMADAMLKERAK